MLSQTERAVAEYALPERPEHALRARTAVAEDALPLR